MPGGVPTRIAERDLSDFLLVALAFGAGAVDAISFLGLGRIFTANMTGNIVLLGIAVGRGASSEVLRSGIAFVMFVVGVLAATLIAARLPAQRSWPSGVKVALAIEAAAQAAFLGGWLASNAHPSPTLMAVLTGVSALAMGLQSGAVRALGVGGISTTYVTGTLTGLLGQVGTGTGSRRDWARRALIVSGLLIGAVCAGVLVVNGRRFAAVLPLGVTLVVLGAAVFVLPRTRRVARTT